MHARAFVIFLLSTMISFTAVKTAFAEETFIGFGLQTPFRFIQHDQALEAVSRLDSFTENKTRSWDGSIGHYFEVGRHFIGQASSPYRCGLKLRGDFDFRSDHNVLFETSDAGAEVHYLELDLSIASFILAGECQRDISADWVTYAEVGGGLAMQVNGIKYARQADSRTNDLPAYVTDNGLTNTTGLSAAVEMDMEPAALLGLGLGYDLTDNAMLRMGGQYRYMGENMVYRKPIHEAALTFGLRVNF